MQIAGIGVEDDDVLELVVLLHRRGFTDLAAKLAGFTDLAEKLPDGAEVEAHMLGLTIDERGAILLVLDDPPTDGLEQLRRVLLSDHAWFREQGLWPSA